VAEQFALSLDAARAMSTRAATAVRAGSCLRHSTARRSRTCRDGRARPTRIDALDQPTACSLRGVVRPMFAQPARRDPPDEIPMPGGPSGGLSRRVRVPADGELQRSSTTWFARRRGACRSGAGGDPQAVGSPRRRAGERPTRRRGCLAALLQATTTAGVALTSSPEAREPGFAASSLQSVRRALAAAEPRSRAAGRTRRCRRSATSASVSPPTTRRQRRTRACVVAGDPIVETHGCEPVSCERSGRSTGPRGVRDGPRSARRSTTVPQRACAPRSRSASGHPPPPGTLESIASALGRSTRPSGGGPGASLTPVISTQRTPSQHLDGLRTSSARCHLRGAARLSRPGHRVQQPGRAAYSRAAGTRRSSTAAEPGKARRRRDRRRADEQQPRSSGGATWTRQPPCSTTGCAPAVRRGTRSASAWR
jgi:hypothetical protein